MINGFQEEVGGDFWIVFSKFETDTDTFGIGLSLIISDFCLEMCSDKTLQY